MKTKVLNSVESKRRKAILLSILYVFILTLTTFHHHPIDLAEKGTFVEKNQSEKSSYSYTTNDCPILNFSNNGFNSFEIFYSSKMKLVSICSIFLMIEVFSIIDNYKTTPPRGPPSKLFI